ncbi:MAG: O-methyltransferase [Parvibaculaceae bacterium]
MTEETWDAVDGYYEDLLLGPDPLLDETLKESSAGGLPEIAVAPNQGKFLMLLAMAVGARKILEIGTLGGYSTTWLARGLAPDGRLVTLEYAPKHAEVARRNLARAGLADRVEVRVGPAVESLPKLVEEGAGPFDLVFIDADKQSYAAYLEWSLKLVRKGSLIVADNMVRDGKVTDAHSGDPLVDGVRRFNERLAAEKRLSATALQTVGVKGYDGFVLALVTGD